LLTRSERIRFLHEHHADVVADTRDRGSGGEQGLPLMYAIWTLPAARLPGARAPAAY